MSLRVRASSAAVLLVALCLCNTWPLDSTRAGHASGNADALVVAAYADLDAPGNSATAGEEVDPEDGEPSSEARDFHATASPEGHHISAERYRSALQDRPPRLARLG